MAGGVLLEVVVTIVPLDRNNTFEAELVFVVLVVVDVRDDDVNFMARVASDQCSSGSTRDSWIDIVGMK